MEESIIVCAFPGTGKTVYNACQYAPPYWSIDSDSSMFSKEGFPDNYIEHIKSNIGKYKYIFVSSHKDVREALVKEGIEFKLVYPAKELKEEYLQRYKERGSSELFIELISKNWDNWIEELKNQVGCQHFELQSNKFISNIF